MILPLILFANIWIWKIFSFNFFIFLFVIIASILLYQDFPKKKVTKKSIVVFVLLLIIQYLTTDKVSLTNISNYDRYIIDTRLKVYPPDKVRLGHFLEEKPVMLVARRIKSNFFDLLDPGLYFFASNPRQRVGFNEFEKFPYILLPFFVIGMFRVFKKENLKLLVLTLLVPVSILSIIGTNNPLGPFVVFPFLVVVITSAFQKLKPMFLVGYFLVFIQVVSYALN